MQSSLFESSEEIQQQELYEKLLTPKRPPTIDACDEYSQPVGLLLFGMGMGKYVDLFQTQNIGLDAFVSMTPEDLRALGITDEDDIKKISGNIDFGESSDMEPILTSFHEVDVTKGMVKQTNKIGLIFQNLVKKLNKAKEKPSDFVLCTKYTQLEVLDIVLSELITQTNKNLQKIYDDQENGLIPCIIKKEKLVLSSFLKKKLTSGSHKQFKNRRLFVLGTASILLTSVFLGFLQFR